MAAAEAAQPSETLPQSAPRHTTLNKWPDSKANRGPPNNRHNRQFPNRLLPTAYRLPELTMSPRFIPLVLLSITPCMLISAAISPAADPPAPAAAAIPTQSPSQPSLSMPNPKINPYSAEAGMVRTGIANSPAEQAIRQTLMHPATLDFTKTPLKDVIDFIADSHHLPVQLDIKAMKEDSQPLDPAKSLWSPFRQKKFRCARR